MCSSAALRLPSHLGWEDRCCFPSVTIGASMVLLEKAGPAQLVDGIERFGATVVFTAPTSYRVMAQQGERIRNTRLRKCVSAGEALTASTRALWRQTTGIEIIDGIGSTGDAAIFISHREEDVRARRHGQGCAWLPCQGSGRAGQRGRTWHCGAAGRTGPYRVPLLGKDSRQTQYVQHGWNLTGDAYLMDADGYFIYQARTDDMIISAGYNIAAPEVEDASHGPCCRR